MCATIALDHDHATGHAMKVTDYARAQGAVLGKAMSALPAGKGLILVLVTMACERSPSDNRGFAKNSNSTNRHSRPQDWWCKFWLATAVRAPHPDIWRLWLPPMPSPGS